MPNHAQHFVVFQTINKIGAAS